MGDCRFEGQDLSCERGERRVFDDLSFRLEAGGALVLTGANGSGKSSLLRLCAGLMSPVSGQLLRNGQRLSDDPDSHRASLHYAGHANALKPVMTVFENIAFWAALYGDTSRVGAALQAFSLHELKDLPARYLSSGQQHRTALARLVAVPQPLWLLDEPAVGLDAAAVAALTALIASHRADGGMVMVSTHTDLGLAAADVLRLDDFPPRRHYGEEVLV